MPAKVLARTPRLVFQARDLSRAGEAGERRISADHMTGMKFHRREAGIGRAGAALSVTPRE